MTLEEKLVEFMKQEGITIYKLRDATLKLLGSQVRREELKAAARRMYRLESQRRDEHATTGGN